MSDFRKIFIVQQKAVKAGVGFSLVFCESDGSYYFTLNSPAMAEGWVGKNRSFDAAVDDVCEWLDND